MPPDFSLDNLPPEQVERIEILRAPTAEYGAQAVAGTINIVLKQALKKTLNELKLGVGVEDNKASPNASYTLTLSVNHGDDQDESDTRSRRYGLPTGNRVLDASLCCAPTPNGKKPGRRQKG